MSKNSTTTRSAFKPSFEQLEDRRLMSGLTSISPSTTLLFPPDNVGNTMASALEVPVGLMNHATVSDNLGRAGDIDFFKVRLNGGDFLAVDVDRTGTSGLAATLNVFDALGYSLPMSHVVRPATEPDSNQFSFDPVLGFYAPTSGDYYLRLATSATTISSSRGYDLDLDRIGRVENGPLVGSGNFHAWLNQTGNTLSIAGPRGLGFNLVGNWTTTTASGETTYRATGSLTLQTAALGGSGIALSIPFGRDFEVVTSTPGWAQLGTLTRTEGTVGVSLQPYMQAIEQRIGIQLGSTTLGPSWKIMTGNQIRATYPQYDSLPVYSGLPYFVYGAAQGQVTAQIGSVQLTKGSADSWLFIVDPTDPMFYMSKSISEVDPMLAGSLKGRLPMPGDAQLPGSGSLMPPAVVDGAHLVVGATFPLMELPIPVVASQLQGRVEVGLDLDANGDGQWLGGNGTAAALFQQEGLAAAAGAVLGDLRLGVFGEVGVEFSLGSYSLDYSLGNASMLFDGSAQAMAFHGAYGTGLNTFAGTPLQYLEAGPGGEVEGYVYSDGRFSVTCDTIYKAGPASADLALTVSSQGTLASTQITATGTVELPFGSAQVSGTIGLNGNYVWQAGIYVDIGGGGNFIRGNATLTISNNAGVLTYTVNGTLHARATVLAERIDGHVSGSLTLVWDTIHNTHDFEANMHFDGELEQLLPIAGWTDTGVEVHANVHIDDDGLSINGWSIDW